MNCPPMNKMMIGLIVAMWSAFVVGHAHSDEEYFSFDTLFPDNWYTKALQTCMHVWTDLDTIITDKSLDSHQVSYMIDAAIGKVMYCRMCVKNLEHDQAVSIVEDDLLYLGRIATSLNNRCEKLINDARYREHAELLKQALQKFRGALSRALGR